MGSMGSDLRSSVMKSRASFHIHMQYIQGILSPIRWTAAPDSRGPSVVRYVSTVKVRNTLFSREADHT